jgi:uncharacterized protein with HEPN domain
MAKASSGWPDIAKKNRKRRTPTQRLQDMKQCAQDLLEYTNKMDRQAFLKDKLTLYASEYTLQIITWASDHVPKPMRKKYPEVDWKRCGTYDKLMMPPDFHPDPRLVWRMIRKEMPPLLKALEKVPMPPNRKRAF